MKLRTTGGRLAATSFLATAACAALIGSASPVFAGGAQPVRFSGAVNGTFTQLTAACNVKSAELVATGTVNGKSYTVYFAAYGKSQEVLVQSGRASWFRITKNASFSAPNATVNAILLNHRKGGRSLRVTGTFSCNSGGVG